MTLVELSTRINPIVLAILRSRAHFLLSFGLMLITVTGRKTGRTYTIPVGYHELDDAVIILVSEPATKVWWKNYLSEGPLSMRIRNKEIPGTAKVLPATSDGFRARLEASLARARFMGRLFDIDYDARVGLTPAQIATLSTRVVVVEVRPTA
jgi:deazaflavin-dependent oxidoreductase (nitroreductase family)